MKIISWNVNGLRAIVKKGFYDFIREENPDLICLQEIKMTESQYQVELDDYNRYTFSANKPGYSGTMVLTKNKPLNYQVGINGLYLDEGRVQTLEFENFYLVNVYSPNSKDGLIRLEYRMDFDKALRNYLIELKANKNVILCGDLNVAHNEIDLKNPSSNRHNPGFSDEERKMFSNLLDGGFLDTFRYLYPLEVKYSWWSYRFNARLKNAGWRIDYFVINDGFKDHLLDSFIYTNIYGSDHAPVGIKIKD